ncbi:MAG: hypothetical protein AAF480_17235 [Actinomycetota bacterium]
MYVSFRNFRAHPGKQQDLIGIATWVCQAMNERAGTDLVTSVSIGGDPDSVSVTGTWASLGAYEQARASLGDDQEIASAARLASELGTSDGDAIGQVLRPAGERSNYVSFNTAEIQLAHIADAAAFVMEVADTASDVTGTQVGLLRPVTGQVNGVLWFSFHDSLQSIQDGQAKMDQSELVLDLYKRAPDVMVPNVLEAGIRQYV